MITYELAAASTLATTPNMQKAIAWLLAAVQPGSDVAQALSGMATKSVTRVEIDGDKVYATLNCYESAAGEVTRVEAHRRYIDIQCVLRGREAVAVADVAGLAVDTPYDAAKDVAFYVPPAKMQMIELIPGTFAVFHPKDAHAPGLAVANAERVEKIVVKVQVE